ncbi:hypothetical protein HMPREF9163_01691 [Selenomonas sp. oral taxon 138 str. F0429]|nr:hypothetical protein HMPREF9163_01691 [Selenomonas sp. oral taxon 138 str. F0429]
MRTGKNCTQNRYIVISTFLKKILFILTFFSKKMKSGFEGICKNLRSG